MSSASPRYRPPCSPYPWTTASTAAGAPSGRHAWRVSRRPSAAANCAEACSTVRPVFSLATVTPHMLRAARTHVGAVPVVERAVELVHVHRHVRLDARKAHAAAPRLHPLHQLLAGHPAADHLEPATAVGVDLRQPGVALREGARRDLLVHHAAADADLLLRGEELMEW